ncbi:MAG: hypothetical protein ACTSSE_09920 [Candidatus Thorarchaeota archaeon]
MSQLLDDFLSPDTKDTGRSAEDIDDEEYIRMMLKKDAVKQLERTKREAQITPSTRSDTIDDNLRQRFFPDVDERPAEKEIQPEVEEKPPEKIEVPLAKKEVSPDSGIVADILDSIVVKDVSGLATRMREAVDFLQDEMGTSDTEQKLIEALERYKKPTERAIKMFSNDNVLVLKRCQNCHYCVGERNRNGSTWCLCTNFDRSTDVEIEDSWVKSAINLLCWKTPLD